MIKINFTKGSGRIPAIIQDEKSGDVLMLGFMNKEAFKKTLESGTVYFWSRSRNMLWKKGEISGNILQVKKIFIDCDNDAALIKVDCKDKVVCHTGKKSCFEIYEYK